MGLKTSQKELREKMLSSNIYSPNTIYDLNNDAVTKTLNKLGSFGIDLRSSLLGSTLEKLDDNTPLTQLSYKYYAKAMGIRAIDNIAHNYLPQVDLNNILSSDPNKKVIQMNKDWSITKSKNNGATKFFKNALGIYDKNSIQSTLENISDSYTIVSEKTGDAQRLEMERQMKGNNFNRYGKTSMLHPIGNINDFKVTQAVYSPDYVTKINSFKNKYTSYVQGRSGNESLSSIDKVVESLKDTISDFDYEKDVVQKEGFGGNRIVTKDPYLEQEQAFLTYINDSSKGYEKPIDKELTSDVQMDNFKIQRGLLYYTQQIVNSGSQAGRNIAHNSKEFGISDSGMVLYKGSSACRSYTHFDQYMSSGQLIRVKGNGHEASVLKDGVMPKIYPSSSSDTHNLMFSIENLAWTKPDLIAYGIPETQWGSNGGRVMWFPPYGLTFSDNTSVNYDTTNLLGRIEPIYTYNGASRDMSLSFMLIIDTPPHVQYYNKEELAAWFAGCLGKEEPKPKPIVKAPLMPTKPEIRVPNVNIVPKPPTETLFNAGRYFFENNKYEIFHSGSLLNLTRYEITESPKVGGEPTDWLNEGAINKPFGGEDGDLNRIISFMRTKIVDGFEITIDIEGRCSALWTSPYNAKLSYKRADAMMKYIIDAYNENYGGRDGSMLTLGATIDYDKVVTLAYAKTGKKIEYKTKNGLVKFRIKGVGEELTKLGQNETEKNKLDVKKTRFAIVSRLEAKFVGNVQDSHPLAGRVSSINTTNTNKNLDNWSVSDNGSKLKDPKLDWFGNQNSGIGATGWDKMEYYKPTFHSQTPFNFNERIQFLKQTTRPRQSIQSASDIGSNSLFGKMPICVLRIGDYINTKVVVKNVNIDYAETTWDMNPEGMGMQPMIAKVSMDLSVIGAMALEWPVNKILTANDFNFVANGDFYDQDGYYPKERYDYKNAVKPSVEPNAEGKRVPEDPRWAEYLNKTAGDTKKVNKDDDDWKKAGH
jgi:hypothetical protein